MKKHTEIRFEEAIEYYLTGVDTCIKGTPNDYNKHLALFPDDVIEFLKTSQPKYWNTVEEFYGDKSAESILSAQTKELDTKGSLHVLRHGFKFFGKTFKLAFFKPNTNLNPDKVYLKNQITQIYELLYRMF